MSSELTGSTTPPRSPLLMNRSDALVLVIDAQEKLWPAIDGHEAILPRMLLILQAAKVLGIPIVATEQYPKGLGATIAPVSSLVGAPMIKSAFSAGIDPAILSAVDRPGLRKLLLVGIEAHVCVLQSALDFLASGFQVYVAVDAVGSRRPLDKTTALDRMRSAAVTLTTAESAVFEWTVQAGTEEFKRISKLVKEVPV